MVSDYLAIINSAIVGQMILSSRERLSIIENETKPYKFHTSVKKRVLYGVLQNLGFTWYVQNKRTENMLQQVLTEVYNKIDQAKEEIIQELTLEIQRQRIIELTGQVSGLIRNLGYFYDSPTSNKIEMLINDVGKLIGSLDTEMNYVNKPKWVFHIFTLYVLCICLYSLIQFEYISRYVNNDDETNAIIKRVNGEINQAYSKYEYIYDKAYKLIESRFSELTVKRIEPWHNWLNPLGPMVYKIAYTFDKNTIKAIDLKIKQTRRIEYDKNPRPEAIIKVRGDNDYYLWPPGINEKTLSTYAFNKRKKHIEDTFHEIYKEFIYNKGNFMKQIEYHSKIFTNKSLTSEYH